MISTEAMKTLLERVALLHPAVASATAEELIEHGWGDTERDRIPPDWRTSAKQGKRCSGCRRTLELEAFRKRALSHDGLQAYCITCSSEANKSRREKKS